MAFIFDRSAGADAQKVDHYWRKFKRDAKSIFIGRQRLTTRDIVREFVHAKCGLPLTERMIMVDRLNWPLLFYRDIDINSVGANLVIQSREVSNSALAVAEGAGKVLKYTGRVILVTAVAMDAIRIGRAVVANDYNRFLHATFTIAGGWAGGLCGAKAVAYIGAWSGALIGCIFDNVANGAAVGYVAGGVVGGVFGGLIATVIVDRTVFVWLNDDKSSYN